MKSIKRVAAVALAATMAFTALPATKVHAVTYSEKDEWNLYDSGGTINTEEVLYLIYKHYNSHGAKADYVRYENTSVKLTGHNVYLYDIPTGRYTNYNFTPTVLSCNPFRPFSRSTENITKSKLKVTMSSTNSTSYSEGYIYWY